MNNKLSTHFREDIEYLTLEKLNDLTMFRTLDDT